jgi:predicted amino acid racemase
MSYPCLKINLSSISKNSKIINDRCTSSGIAVVGVLKCTLGDLKIAQAMKMQGIEVFGDSRLANLRKLRSFFGPDQELILLRTPMLSEVEEMVNVCDISMNTQIETIDKISEACRYRDKMHRIIIMVETDDSREGLLPREVIPFCDHVVKNCSNINIWGIGTNARCISDRRPLPESIGILLELKKEIERKYPVEIPVISGGNSSVWDLIEKGLMPKGVSQVRMGEIILLGHETANYRQVKNASTDAFLLEAEIIEVKRKDSGIYKLIAALGLQDVHCKYITCDNDSFEVSAQSSDHTVLLVKDGAVFKPGDIITFKLNYFGVLSCMTSPFVEKVYRGGGLKEMPGVKA